MVFQMTKHCWNINFGSEFIAAHIAVELVEGLRYKLRMFGLPIDGPTNMYCDNGSIVTNCTKPESTLKKKHNAIAYHKVRESVAQGTICIAKENGETNLADVLTKPLPGPRLKDLTQHILYWQWCQPKYQYIDIWILWGEWLISVYYIMHCMHCT